MGGAQVEPAPARPPAAGAAGGAVAGGRVSVCAGRLSKRGAMSGLGRGVQCLYLHLLPNSQYPFALKSWHNCFLRFGAGAGGVSVRALPL